MSLLGGALLGKALADVPAAPSRQGGIGRSLWEFLPEPARAALLTRRTTGVDVSHYVEAALQFGGTITVPDGRYIIARPVVVRLARSAALVCGDDVEFIFPEALQAQAFRIDGSGRFDFRVRGGRYDMSAVRSSDISKNVGTVFDFHRLRIWRVVHADFRAGSSLSELGGDNGIDAVDCGTGLVDGCTFEGFADGGIYLSGANDPGPADDGGPTAIVNSHFRNCSTGVEVKRKNRDVRLHANHFVRCHVGFGVFEVGVGEVRPGDRLNATGNTLVDCVIPIDMRGGEGRSVFSGNRIEDFGYAADGKLVPSPAAILLRGVSDCLVSGNSIGLVARRLDRHAGVIIAPYVAAGRDYAPTNNAIVANHFMRLSRGVVEETGAGPTLLRANTFSDVAQETSLSHAASRTR